MKIIVLGLRGFPNIQGGVETHCEHLYTRIAARGHEVIVIGRAPYMKETPREYKGVVLLALACPRQKMLEAFLHTLLGILKASFARPDILHIHAIGPSLLVPIARLLGMNVVSTNHGPDYDRAKWAWFAKAVLRLGEAAASRFAHGLIAISEPIAAHLRGSFGREPAVIPNGVVVRPGSPAKLVQSRYGLTLRRYILAVGRLVPEKGFHDLIEAFGRVGLPDWKLVIAGGADHEDSYSRMLKDKAGRSRGVVMTGFTTGDALCQLYSHAGLFVLPSYHEGLPIVLLEAMSYGLPVLASDIPANRAARLPPDRLFSPGDVEGAASAMRRLALQSFPEEMRRQQIDFIARTFDWERITDSTLAVYSSVLRPADGAG